MTGCRIRPRRPRGRPIGIGLRVLLAANLALSACVQLRELPSDQLRAEARSAAPDEVPGIAVATVDDGEIQVAEAGSAALLEARPVAPDTAFLWFSITKLFTATAIMQLHERGRLDIDAPVRDLLQDEWPVREPVTRPVTARDLLSHSSGLGNPSVWDRARPAGQPYPGIEQQLAELLREHGPRLRARPGTRHRYSNLGYLVLGRMIELADGRDYERYICEEILEVLDMRHTGFRWSALAERDTPAALGHSKRGGFYTSLAKRVANPDIFAEPVERWETTVAFEVDGTPYGGLIGSAGDLARFVSAHLHYGQWRDRRILSPASVQAMQTVQHDRRGEPLPYALGWHTGLIEGERYFNHMGKGGGYRPAVRIWPGRRYGVVVLTNRTRFDPRPLTRTVPPRESAP